MKPLVVIASIHCENKRLVPAMVLGSKGPHNSKRCVLKKFVLAYKKETRFLSLVSLEKSSVRTPQRKGEVFFYS